MLSIGEFSRICNITTKTLRYYDSTNILKPFQVNKDNDYRYYEASQIKEVLFINKLKKYGFSLSEISEIMNKDYNKDFIELLIEKKNTMEEEIKKQKEILKSMERDINKLKSGEDLLNFNEDIDITIVDSNSIKIVSLRRKIQEDNIGELFKELVPIINEKKLELYGSPITIWHDKEYNENKLIDMEVAIPVKRGKGEYIRVLEGNKCIYTKYKGPYENLPHIIQSLYIWKERNGYEVIASPYQKYIKGIHNLNNPKDYETELYIPIIKNKNY